MNETTAHGHVTSLCRHCLKSDTMAVEASLEKANEFMYDLPHEFERMADSLPVEQKREISILRSVIVRRYDDDVYRVRVGGHDLVVTSVTCDGDYDACKQGFRQYLRMRNFEHQAQEILGKMFKDASKEEPSLEQLDKSFDILSQIDLPQDFFGTQGPN